jgi:pimeloyl-ACP methyl ester carboxylesterase
MQHRSLVRAKFFVACTAAVVAATACKKPQSDVGEPRSSASIHAGQLPAPEKAPPPRSAKIETVEVPGDRKLLVFDGEDTKRPIIYLHGMCSEPRSDLDAWASSVSSHGTVVAVYGDAACPNKPGGYTWTTDAAAIDARIDAAVSAVQASRGRELDVSQLVVIGESMGAARAAALARHAPAKYTRLVLVGSPELPAAKDFRSAHAVALLAGEKEPQEKMRQGEVGLSSAGIHARFWELPDATHGTYGPEGHNRMAEAIAFVTSR